MAALTLIEILIAMFIFLVGGLGVISLFPVAMKNAERVLSETRGNVLAQSVVAQITADCRVNFELPATGSAAAGTTTGVSPTTITRQIETPVPTAKNQYFVTLLDGPGRGQSRFITLDSGGTNAMNVWPQWTPVTVQYYNGSGTLTTVSPQWTAPGSLPANFPNEHYSITRMGLPDRPIYYVGTAEQILQGQAQAPGATAPPTTPYYVSAPQTGYCYGSYGLNRDLAIRSFTPKAGTGTASPNGFYAGIANWKPNQTSTLWWNWALYPTGPSVPTVDAFLAYTNTKTTNASTDFGYLRDNTGTAGSLSGNAKTFSGPPYYQVRIVSGTGAGQVRSIISPDTSDSSNNSVLISPNWTCVPDSTSQYEIGWANTTTAVNPPQPLPPPTATAPEQNATWCAQVYPLPTAAGASTGSCSGSTLTDNTSGGTPPAWATNQFQGKYVYIYDAIGNPATGVGQACAIVSNSGSAPYTLTVTPAFAPVSGSPNYIITESRGYVLITSGRATNRLFPIAWDSIDNTNGHLIVCAGANFQSLTGITAAQKASTNTAPGYSYSYNLQDATTFTVIGNWNSSQLAWPYGSTAAPYPSMPLILNAVPDGSGINPQLWLSPPSPPWGSPSQWGKPNPPPWLNTLNMVNLVDPSGTVSSNPTRLALDQYNGTTLQGGAYTSDYSYGVIFSDSGTDPSLPVRVDVLVWRNFDATKDFAQNQKPVGHMSGYIKRP